ncbi:hypothetical protein [Mycobacterium riyadhense]|uniref:hypothetical protein n=1 Tax=Mycobacterium riyadhense TaxID=486698 RepID=UPI00194FE246|nr:hypothetical protein [Mycobacterium riyadhense]
MSFGTRARSPRDPSSEPSKALSRGTSDGGGYGTGGTGGTGGDGGNGTAGTTGANGQPGT